MSPAEFAFLVREFVRIVAEKLGVPVSESVDETRDRIKKFDSETSALLEHFLNRYCEWDDFGRRVEAKELQGALTPDESAQLTHLVGQRNASREALKARLAQL